MSFFMALYCSRGIAWTIIGVYNAEMQYAIARNIFSVYGIYKNVNKRPFGGRFEPRIEFLYSKSILNLDGKTFTRIL